MNPAFAAWGRLFRLSLSPTAIGDVFAGSALVFGALGQGHRINGQGVLLLVLASLCVYHAGMAFNDWCDRGQDARTRPERPLPAGAISSSAALAVSVAGFAVGPCLAWAVSPGAGAWALGLAGCAALYDFRGRGPWSGPLLLGMCRAMNLALPLVAFGGGSLFGVLWIAPLAYGLYVFLLSRLGRLEDGEAKGAQRQTPRRLLVALGLLFWFLPWLPLAESTWIGRSSAFLIGASASFGLFAWARRLGDWIPADLIPAMGCALRRMLPFSAALACLPGTAIGLGTAVVILSLFPVAVWLRGIFPPS